jgi:hypothetical protein
MKRQKKSIGENIWLSIDETMNTNGRSTMFIKVLKSNQTLSGKVGKKAAP